MTATEMTAMVLTSHRARCSVYVILLQMLCIMLETT